MSILLSLLGVGLVIFALVTIHFGNKKSDEKERNLDAYEGTLLELKKNIEDMDRKVKENYAEKTKELERVLKECDRKILILDNKIKEGNVINNILVTTFEKVNEVEVNAKPNFHLVNEENNEENEEEVFEEDYEDDFLDDEEYDEVEEVDLEEILELYKDGKSLNEISEITGKSLEDIAVIMGLWGWTKMKILSFWKTKKF